MTNKQRRSAAVLLSLSLAHCGLRQLPSCAPSSHEIPRINNAPGTPAEGEGQVAIDVIDGPTQVSIPTGSSSGVAVGYHSVAVAEEETVRDLCISPCVVTLPRGTHNLRLRALRASGSEDITFHTDHVLVDVRQRPSALRAQLGATDAGSPHLGAFGMLLLSFGLSGLVTGGTLEVLARQPDAEQQTRDMEPASISMIAIGTGLTVVGAILMAVSRGSTRDGASTQWTPSSGNAWVSE